MTFQLYASLRPEDFCGEEAPFYIAVKAKTPTKTTDWYKKQPLGVNKLSSFGRSMVESAGISDGQKLTNTSYRKHLAARLNESFVPKEVGRHVTGHKQASSLDNYAPLSTKQQRLLSDIVGGENINFNNPTVVESTTPVVEAAPSIVVEVDVPVSEEGTVSVDVSGCSSSNSNALIHPYPQSCTIQPPVFTSSTNTQQSITAAAPQANAFPGILQGANIQGGSFQIKVHQHFNSHLPVKRKRINVIESDESD